MRIALHTPFKPLNHPRLSGDVTIARDVADFLRSTGNEVTPVLSPTSKWLWRNPAQWEPTRKAARNALSLARASDAWLTYHTYYKTPDVIGPWAAKKAGIPYCIFSGAYARKRLWDLKTAPGYLLNRRALTRADHIFCNKRDDFINCLRLLPPERVTYIRPGIVTRDFAYDEEARARLRKEWLCQGKVVVITAAILREGVKTQGVRLTVDACAQLINRGIDLKLVVAGDGPESSTLMRYARDQLPGKVRFLGMVPRAELGATFSAADIFAFPGINEGLGMVYLEAQAAGLPAVAWDHMGAPEVVSHEESGFITPSFDMPAYAKAIEALATDRDLRSLMSRSATEYVEQRHEIANNYAMMNSVISKLRSMQ